MVNLGDLGLWSGNPGDMFEVVGHACRSKAIQVEEGSSHFRSSNEGLPSLKLTIRPTWAGSQKGNFMFQSSIFKGGLFVSSGVPGLPH